MVEQGGNIDDWNAVFCAQGILARHKEQFPTYGAILRDREFVGFDPQTFEAPERVLRRVATLMRTQRFLDGVWHKRRIIGSAAFGIVFGLGLARLIFRETKVF